MLYINFAQGIGDLGLASALIQHEDLGEPALSTAFWANLGVGIALAAVSFALAVPITTFLGDVSAAPILQVLSISFAITSMVYVPTALLWKELKLQYVTTRQMVGQVVFGMVGILMAFFGFGVWSLAGATIAQSIAEVVLIWSVSPWRPRRQFDRAAFRSLFSFGSYALASSLLTRAFQNVDYFVVGRWLGAEALGYYTLAYQLSIIPQRRLVVVVQGVTFPAFALIQNQRARMRNGFLEGMRHLFALLIPAGLFLALFASALIATIYGAKWLPAAGALRILAIAGIFCGFDAAESVFMAVSRPNIRMWLIALRVLLFLAFAAAFGVTYGVVGISVSLALAIALSSAATLPITGRILGTSVTSILAAIWPPVRAALFAFVPVLAVAALLQSWEVSPWIILITLGAAAALLYLAASVPAYRGEIGSAFALARRRLPGGSRHDG
jgi:PST family polysaccharide transporter